MREHVMQPVAKLVEQGQHFIVPERRRPAAARPCEIAGQIGDRRRERSTACATAAGIVLPRAALLVLARV